MANTNRFKINGLRLELGESEAMLPVLAAKKLGISQGDILSLRILRRSLDARKKNDIFVSYNIEAEVDGACSALLLRRGLHNDFAVRSRDRCTRRGALRMERDASGAGGGNHPRD